MKNLLTLLIGLAFSYTGFAQSCLPEGITFYSQSEIDNFQTNYPNCTQVEGGIQITGNGITNLDGLSNITSIGGNLYLGDYDYGGIPFLTSLSGLNGLLYIGGGIHIYECDQLTDLTGLDNITTLGTHLWIEHNSNLTSLNGLENLVYIGGQIQITYNDALASLSGLDSLTHIGSHLVVCDNPNLISIESLKNIDAASIDGLAIYENSSLPYCAVKSICEFLADPKGYVLIHDNDKGCNSQEQIEAACKVGVDDNIKPECQVHIYPSPSTTAITIALTAAPVNSTTLSIYNINTQQVILRHITELTTVLDIGTLPSGVYFARVTTDRTVMVSRFIKQ